MAALCAPNHILIIKFIYRCPQIKFIYAPQSYYASSILVLVWLQIKKSEHSYMRVPSNKALMFETRTLVYVLFSSLREHHLYGSRLKKVRTSSRLERLEGSTFINLGSRFKNQNISMHTAVYTMIKEHSYVDHRVDRDSDMKVAVPNQNIAIQSDKRIQDILLAVDH